MTRDEQEMALWREAYWACRVTTPTYRATEADAAVAEFRRRYPPQPQAPDAVWYDEPPFEKDGTMRACWIAGHSSPFIVYWAGRNWRAIRLDDRNPDHLDGRRVCPITKPQEPTT